MDLSYKLAEYIINTNYEDLSQEVIDFTKLCILDYFGSAVAGSSGEPVHIMHDLVQELGGKEQATLITGEKTSVLHASLFNGSAGHVVEQDDIHKGSIIHAGTVIIPSAIAVAEWKQCSGKELLNAIVVGYEVAFRIGEAVSPSHYYFWHNTGTCGTFGAATAAAKLLQLNEQQLVNMLGSAGTQAAGLWEFIEDGAMSKQLHTGKAAMNGVMSALLSKRGFTGAQQILEGERGFFKAMSTSSDATKITKNLGNEYKILENSFKVHASCRHTHSAMDVILDLVDSNEIKTENINQIVVGTYQTAIDITDNDSPKTVNEAKFSLQFCTALVLVKRQGDLTIFNDKTLWDPEIRQLMDKVKIEVDTTINNKYPEKWSAVVRIDLGDGKNLKGETEYPKGDPENPVSKDELITKYRLLTSNWNVDASSKLLNNVLDLEHKEKINIL